MRTRPFKLALACLAFCAQTWGAEPHVAPDTIAARAGGCSTCHGARGEGTSDRNFPRIAGKPAGYLFNQMQNFRDGRRSYPPMNYLLAYMHDDYMAELAAYFAAQPAPAQTDDPSSASTNGAGEHLVRHGNAAAGVPACVLCHGASLTGLQPGIPGLIGLNRRYIAAQLVSWRVGTREARDPDCMRSIAARLTEDEIREAAAWIAAQPVPVPATPAPSNAWTTPIPCGSEP